jgi:hypothetical protein
LLTQTRQRCHWLRQDGKVHDSNGNGDLRRGSVAPRVLTPILAIAERVDRRLRRITPIRPGALLGVEQVRYGGEPVTLEDGTVVRTGDRADIIHFDNRRLRELAGEGWQLRALEQARADLAVLAGELQHRDATDRPVAYHGATVLAPYAVRIGWELHPRTPTAWHRLQDWYLRSLLSRWSPQGRARLQHGHGALGVGEVWISTARLLALFGRAAGQ